MNVTDALFSRFSCRAFKPEPVGKDALLTLLKAALRTPSWANSQPWEIFVAGGEVLKTINREFLNASQKGLPANPDVPRPKAWPDAMNQRRAELNSGMAAAAGEAAKQFGELNQKFFHAPAVLYLCMDKSLSSWSLFDLGALSQSIMLAATEQGLATMPAVNLVLYPEILHWELNIPPELEVVFGIAIGYEDAAHPINRFRSSRRPVEEVAAFRGFD